MRHAVKGTHGKQTVKVFGLSILQKKTHFSYVREMGTEFHALYVALV
ncbi:hypothetical protein SAMN02745702_00456 [Desulfobaculum bizertense DSM 18034]|uniref:Uncharacterized protein n=1 Tax=Desulfobaculum bizertense DSM 18034 TaxID=1121442 RepID=A0A1T4VJI8_9BACT|nr:hypothetical protein SAMN02745702_00456 [Desulfobaculum bizertense DSM 18034]